MQPVVFIHTNDYQLLGAKISAHAFKKRSPHPDLFDVRILRLEETPQLYSRFGQSYLRTKDREVLYHEDNPQSFTPLRFLPPQLMGYEGRALVVDPDVFAVGDVYELLSRDMEGKAIMCRRLPGAEGNQPWATSSMLMDCSRLTHWKWDEHLEDMFAGRRIYQRWIHLEYEPQESIGLLESGWNDLDNLSEKTKLIHFTRQRTQPWKTGLPLLSSTNPKFAKKPPFWMRLLRIAPMHTKNPDPRQEELFFELLREAVDDGAVSEDELIQEIEQHGIRRDTLQILHSVKKAA